MARRRDLLRYGVATTLLPLAQRAAATPLATAAPARLVVRGIVVEPWFAAGAAGPHHAAAQGLTLLPLGTDIAAFWFDVLRPRLDQSSAAIAGLTGRSALFCLLELARDANLRLRYSAVHAVDPASPAASWPTSFVTLLARAPDCLPSPPPALRRAIAGATGADTLHSWLIGPRAARCSA